MPTAIQMHFDSQTDSTIRDVWLLLSLHNISSRPITNSHTPHLTIHYGELDNPESYEWPSKIQSKPFCIQFTKVNTFGADSGILFLSPEENTHLSYLNAVFDADANFDVVDRLYRPESWIPHCTLATRLNAEQMRSALCLLQEIKLPIMATCTSINLVTYPDSTIYSTLTL